jgi:hypothetical protein
MLLLSMACVGTIPGADEKSDDEIAGTYQLGWPIGTCQDEVTGTEGYKEGNTLPDYTWKAQTGEDVRLYDFCNQVVYLELGYFT